MPNLKLSEYVVKKLFYKFTNKKQNFNYTNLNKPLDGVVKENLVAKIDDGSKRRFKRGLVLLNQTIDSIKDFIKEHPNKNIFVEPMVDIEKEYYIMIRNENDANKYFDTIYFNMVGGIDQHDPLKNAIIINVLLDENLDIDNMKTTFTQNNVTSDTNLLNIIMNLFNFYRKYHFTFMEVNPLVKSKNGSYGPVDFAGMIDSCAAYLFDEEDRELVEMPYLNVTNHTVEADIAKLDSMTGSSLKFTMINPMGTVWTLVAGGGASVVYTDAIVNLGYLNQLGNYGEYSGNPPKELVTKYVDFVFDSMYSASKSQDNMILFIGGGIANFTDIYKTFEGIFNSIDNHITKHNDDHIFKKTKVYVRRGGPNYKRALARFAEIAKKYQIDISIHGPESNITDIVTMALSPLEFTRINYNKLEFNKSMKEYLVASNLKISKDDNIMVYSYNMTAVQRMLDFDYISGRDPSVIGILDPRKTKDMNVKFNYGGSTILIPLISNFKKGMKKFRNADHIVSFASFRSAFKTTMEMLDYDHFNSITIIAEGIPEQKERLLCMKAKSKNKVLIGPATVGMISPGNLRIGNTGGSNENIIDSKLYRQGSVGFVTRSGGLLNELCNILSQHTDGVHTGISIGGDRFPGSNFINFLMNYQNNPEIKMMVFIGEVGGIQELIVAEAVRRKLITKPIIGYCIGIAGDYFTNDIQFGHAGASANSEFESAIFKNYHMKKNGVIVPDSFEMLADTIKNTFNSLDIDVSRLDNIKPNIIPQIKEEIEIFSSISNEMGDELKYNNINISEIVNHGIGYTIGQLWLKKSLPVWAVNYIELILKLTADHGAMVSGASNTIVASRASKDLISSLCSGLLTIGDLFGGALNEAGTNFYYAFHIDKETPEQFVNRMKKEDRYISGIGHRVKSKDNPDKRVEILKNFVMKNFPKMETTDYALNVEKITLMKRNNLILNVDGMIAASMIDMLMMVMDDIEDVEDIITSGLFNGFFVLGRSIGFIGHWYDQKRLKQGLYRRNKKHVKYIK